MRPLLVSATVFENTGQDLLEGNRRSGGSAEVAPVARIAEKQQSAGLCRAGGQSCHFSEAMN